MFRRLQTSWSAWLFVGPATVYLLAFSLLPMIVALGLSFFRWPLARAGGAEYVGWANYAALISDPFFLNAIGNTLRFTAMAVPGGMVLALAAALLLNLPLRGVAIFRTVLFLPSVSSLVALSMVWIWVYLPEQGLINSILRSLGFDGSTDFLKSTRWALPALVLMNMWTGLGPRMVLFLAGLQGIPSSLYEAAELDGCNAWQRFRHITWPMLLPTTFFVLITSTIACFKFFTEVYIMTQGGPRRATDVVAYHIFRQAWTKFELGMASAQTYVLFLLILAAVVLQFRFMRRQVREVEQAWAR